MINADNWLPHIMFHVLAVVFRFYSQAYCHKEDFCLISTMRFFRVGMQIVQGTTAYLRESNLWGFMVARLALEK